MEKVNLKRYTISCLGSYLSGLGLKRYRPSQVTRWLYQKGASSISEMTDLSMDEREILSKVACIGRIEPAKSKCSIDGTRKFLFKLEDGDLIESVLIPDGDR
ncbi:MAG TPA: 23S rRNA (adenine(2503)-C(2))-methyltransferase RlmN, partial [Nitrospiria bacterium]|nr:23S rRNA (adenine(2503)-C(2))-methyltransferase RlmN [Nitrospiria bacterium]